MMQGHILMCQLICGALGCADCFCIMLIGYEPRSLDQNRLWDNHTHSIYLSLGCDNNNASSFPSNQVISHTLHYLYTLYCIPVNTAPNPTATVIAANPFHCSS